MGSTAVHITPLLPSAALYLGGSGCKAAMDLYMYLYLPVIWAVSPWVSLEGYVCESYWAVQLVHTPCFCHCFVSGAMRLGIIVYPLLCRWLVSGGVSLVPSG
jgi:hypothetical protein